VNAEAVATDVKPGTRVLAVIGQLDLGGAEKHLARVMSALRARGLDVRVFALKGGGALVPTLQAAGVPVYVHARRGPGLRGLLQAACLLRRVVRRERPDVLHFFLPAAYLVGMLATAGQRTRRVMSRRSLANYQAGYPGVRLLERFLHGRLDAVLANSRAVADELLAEGVPAHRLGLIYNGVAWQEIATTREIARERLGLPPDALVFVCVANLIPYKGHADLLAAFEIARDRLPTDWLLLLLGRDDGIGPALQAQAARAGIGDRVQWAGTVDEVGDYLAAADIGVLASHEEGFSNAILEGMAAGLPMVVTDVGGNAEAILDGTCGRVVAAHAPVKLAEALVELATSPALRVQWGDYARHRVRERFTQAQCVESYWTLYANLANGTTPPIPAGARMVAQ
jgi:glycosyltransferase involved in cell wall biosynthesis